MHLAANMGMFVNVYLQDYLFDQTYRWSWIVGLSTILGTATVEKKEVWEHNNHNNQNYCSGVK